MRLAFSGLCATLRITARSYPLVHRRLSSNMSSTVNKTAHAFDKVRLDALLNRRFFYAPAFEIYGGGYFEGLSFQIQCLVQRFEDRRCWPV